MSLQINLDLYPPAVQAAVIAILYFEDEMVDSRGYDVLWYKHDLPRIVAKALGNERAVELLAYDEPEL